MEQNIVQTAAELQRKALEAVARTEVGNSDIMVFPDKTVLNLESYASNPRRKRASVCVLDQASFADYVNQHKSPSFTALFGVITEVGGSFSGIIDYHEKEKDGALSPQWGDHKVGLTLAFTPEWKKWMARHDTSQTQVEFADFIEDNMLDIVKPSAADLLEIAQELVAKKSVDFKSGIRLNNGQQSIIYDEKLESGSKAGGKLDVPSEFTIVLAPFVGSEPQQITARLRFRIDNGRLSFIYKLNQPQRVLDKAFTAARVFIATQTGLPVLLGTATVNKP